MSNFIALTCPRCGGELYEKNGKYKCTCCDRSYERESTENIADKMKAVLGEQKQEAVANLRQRLWEEVHKKYVSNANVSEICSGILNYLPNDFYAGFYHATCSEQKNALSDFFENVNLDDWCEDIPEICDYLITALRPEWTICLSGIIEWFKNRDDLENYNKYRTQYEREYDSLEDGVFTPSLHRDVFMCYSSKDMGAVDKLVCELENEGITCFVAARNLRHGAGSVDSYHDAIHTAIKNCKIVLFVSSVNSRSLKCEATSELSYIEEKRPDMPRVEFLLQNYKNFKSEQNVKDFFKGLEYCVSVDDTVKRVIKMLKQPKAEEEAKRKAEEEAKLKAEEAKRRREEAKRQREEAKRKAEREILRAKNRKRNIAIAKRAMLVVGIILLLGGICFGIVTWVRACNKPNTATVDGITYEFSESDCAVVGYDENTIGDKVEILDTYNGLPVVDIAENAFKDCDKLVEITIPNSITKINAKAFSGCTNLNNITVNASNKYYRTIDGSLYSKDGKRLVVFAKAKTVELADGCNAIGDYAFSGMDADSITLPEGIVNIGNYSFDNCTLIESITLSSTVATIGDYAFNDCDLLNKIIIPSSVNRLSNMAFLGCNWLNTIEVSEDNATYKSVDGILYSKDGRKLVCYPKGKIALTYNIPEGVTAIADYAFSGNENITEIVIPDSVTSDINSTIFGGCKNLQTLVIGNGVTAIRELGLARLSNLENVTVGSGVTTIESYAFEDCASLKSIVIPIGVTTVGECIFFGNKDIEVYCEAQAGSFWNGYAPDGWDFDWDVVRYETGCCGARETYFVNYHWGYVE